MPDRLKSDFYVYILFIYLFVFFFLGGGGRLFENFPEISHGTKEGQQQRKVLFSLSV